MRGVRVLRDGLLWLWAAVGGAGCSPPGCNQAGTTTGSGASTNDGLQHQRKNGALPAKPDRRAPRGEQSVDPESLELTLLEAVPDYHQLDPAYGGFVSSANYCAPVAASNSLMALAERGFPKLAPVTGNKKRAQHDLIVTLGSQRYFDTNSLFSGTPPHSLLSGLKAYITDRGYAIERLAWQGWSPIEMPQEFDTGVLHPNVEWIKAGVQQHGGVWLVIAWADHRRDTNRFHITGGHWVTVVGHGRRKGQGSPDILVVNDPLTDESQQRHSYLVPSQITSGELYVDVPNVPHFAVPAQGFYELSGVASSKQRSILAGAVVLEMQRR